MYVSASGNDVNDGKSWDTAKLTVYGALQALPGGSTGSYGIGTIYVADGSTLNPTGTAGIWLMGPSDPNFGSPPPGWLKQGSFGTVTITGVPVSGHGPNEHKNRAAVGGGSSSDNNHPCVWLSGVSLPVVLQNLACVSTTGRGIVIGECSNNTRTNTCSTVGHTLENVSVGAGNGASNGPGIDITGNSYWIYMRDMSVSGNAVNATGAPTSNISAAILIDGTGNNGNGLIYIQDSNVADGGIKVIPSVLTPGEYHFQNITLEGDFTHNMPPAVWFTAGLAPTGVLESILSADPGPSPLPTIQNDNLFSPGLIISDVVGGVRPSGGGVVLGESTTPLNASSSTPRFNGQTGFFNGYMIGETDAARRIAGLVPNRFTNQGNNNSATWVHSNTAGIQTITPGQTDPYGGTGATKASSSAATIESLTLGPCVSYTTNAGDWIIGGVWAQGFTPGNVNLAQGCSGFGSPTFSASYSNNGIAAGNSGDWQFYWVAGKVNGGSATQLALTAYFNNTITPTLYGPVFYIIPSGTLSDNEALELAANMNSVDNACPAGSTCNVNGHPLSVDQLSLRNCVVTGQVLTAQNGSPMTCASPGITDGNSGAAVTTTPYTIQCDSGSTLIDRAHILRLQPSASVVTVPLSTASGCAGLTVAVANDGAGIVTFNRTSADTFTIFTGGTSIDSATSFTLANGQHATLNQGATGIWEVRITAAFSGGTIIDAAAPPYNVLSGNSWIDATWTNGSNTVTIGASDAPFTTAMNGWLCGGTSGTVNGLTTDASSVLVKVLGTFTYVSSTSGTCSGTAANASASGTNNGVLVMGPDDTAALTAAWQAATGGASGTGQSQCKGLQLPAGIIFTKTGQFNTVNCNNAMTGPTSAGPWIFGWGRTVTRIVPAFDQFNFTGVTYSGKNCLFFCHNGINVNNLVIWGAGYQNTGSNTAVMVACSNDSQINQLEINNWGVADAGPLIAFWVPSGLGCGPAYGITILESGSIGCEFDGNVQIGTSECGPSGKRSLVINSTLHSNGLLAGLPTFNSGSSGSTTDVCSGGTSVVCISSTGIWYSTNDQVGGSTANTGVDIRLGGIMNATGFTTANGPNLGIFDETGSTVYGCNSFFAGVGTTAAGIFVQSGATYRSICGNNFFSGTSGGAGIAIQSATSTVILNPTDNWNIANQALPTVTGTVFGTSPTVNTCGGLNTAESGCVVVTEGSTPPSSGTFVLTFNQTYQFTSKPVCQLGFQNGTGSWNARVSAVTTTQSTTAYTWTIDNNSVALTNGSTYGVTWNCVAR